MLDEGRYTATYKYAVLLALMDLCLERTQAAGTPPDTVTTPELAEKIVEIYWPHTAPFGKRAPGGVGAPPEHQRSGRDRVGHHAVSLAICAGGRCSSGRFICRLTAAVCAPSIPLTAGRARSARPEAHVRCACGSSGGSACGASV